MQCILLYPSRPARFLMGTHLFTARCRQYITREIGQVMSLAVGWPTGVDSTVESSILSYTLNLTADTSETFAKELVMSSVAPGSYTPGVSRLSIKLPGREQIWTSIKTPSARCSIRTYPEQNLRYKINDWPTDELSTLLLSVGNVRASSLSGPRSSLRCSG